MTREEAISVLRDMRILAALPKRIEALSMAISALREQKSLVEKQATSDKKASEGCDFCKGARYIYCDMSANGKADETYDFVHGWHGDVTICPLCGRRLEEV